ncbi:phage major capsid protein [Singulisphaera sp. PoT]|uniref:phage major capsid protein n=1 Tax=Singulisphaera sp. PoT TaxID=3411797 RepID=UPI003BF522D9
MATKAVELREERATEIAQARAKWTEAEKREGGPTEEDKASFDAAMDGADKLLERAKRLERLEEAEGDAEAPEPRKSTPIDPEERSGGNSSAEASKSRKDYRHFLKTGEVRQNLRADQARLSEYRDTIISTDGKGGYLIAPVQVSQDIVKAINDQVFIRPLATVLQVTEAKKLGIRKMTTRMADADWTTEVAGVTEDTTMALDRRDLEPQLVSKLSKASIRTLMLSADAEKLINDELAYKFGITEEKAFLTGNGTGKPLGVFTASASGISTGRDVAAAGSTAVTADDLINAKFSVKQGYLQDPSAGWIMHRDTVKMIRKLKNSGDGQYVWQAGLTSGAPDRILDVPYYMSEYAPNTFTTGLYVAVIGNFKYYRIAEVIDLVIQRLVERYADTNEVGFIGRRWVDGAPVLEEAFARLKLA